ncbi:hypothetical protein BT63DRAFT_369723 [Microthyrium microscopicum]|uniref:Uncharacterized protein n=1 Tax=Microthyrium microscopicum TaxID=703497 RepID=A0A6A6UJ71_9PEZI|nr:hypothetical protein BT63DRAFT_369723 [Microthyrium microscopicum]
MPKDGSVKSTKSSNTEYASISKQWADAKAVKQLEATQSEDSVELSRRAAASLKQAEILFTVKQGLLMTWFAILVLLHVLGLYLFTSGFLLTRMVLDDTSNCTAPPVALESKLSLGNSQTGCWHPKSFDKAVVIIIDALRYDFTVPYQAPEYNLNEPPRHYHDALTVLYETAVQSPENAVLLPFIADPPTTTLQRIKGLTTGTLPTFIEAGSNFAGEAIEEDNLIAQLRTANRSVVHIGDDTWHALFPGYFNAELTKPYDSLNVWDLHTVDTGVITHLLPLMQPANASRWDFLIGHLLGVDHAGHRYGPDHAAMADKLRQMDRFLRDVIAQVDERTLLVVMGDHGMDSKGDHGGESDDEVQAALWMYSKKPFFGRRKGTDMRPPMTAKERAVGQIDLVPTLSLLLGLPIPFNNLGAPIFEAFAGRLGTNWENLSRVYRLAGAQIARYMGEYAAVRKLESTNRKQYDMATTLWGSRTDKRGSSDPWEIIHTAYWLYQKETLKLCKSLWAQFDVTSMVSGITVLALTLGVLLVYSRSIPGNLADLSPLLVRRAGIGLVLGVAAGFGVNAMLQSSSWLGMMALSTAIGGLLGSVWGLIPSAPSMSLPIPRSIFSWISVIFTLALSIGFASNSYTIWEDRILLFFLTTLSILFCAASLRQENVVDRAYGCYHSILFGVLTRLASFSRLCREEQMPYCESTYYSSSSSSTIAAWQLLIPVAIAFALPGIIKQYHQNTQSYHHSAVLWYGFAFRSALWLSAVFWLLNTADDHAWLSTYISESTMKTTKVMLAQTALGIAIAVGYSIYAWSAPFLSITTSTPTANSPPIAGLANVHGTRYLPLLTIYLAPILLLQKPLGAGTTALLAWQILALLELLSTLNLASPIGPTTLALLASFHYFTTGHTATLSSLQWDAAFIPLHTIRQPFSAILIALNTLGPHILCALAVPLIPLWRAAPREKGLMGKVAGAVGVHVAVYATWALATCLWAMWLRRHLMLFRVFCPRFLLAGVTLVGVDVVVVLAALGGLRWWGLSVGGVLGFPD